MVLDGYFSEALWYCSRPLPFPHSLEPHSLIVGALWAFPSPPGHSAGLATPPFGAVRDFGTTRARVSLGLRLAPALLLGLGSPLTLSLCLHPSTSALIMPDKHTAKPGPSSGALMGGNPHHFSFDWFSDSEDHLTSVLAEADAAQHHLLTSYHDMHSHSAHQQSLSVISVALYTSAITSP
jgi:hypothetical protein